MKNKEMNLKDILVWMSKQKKFKREDGFYRVGYDVTINHLFCTNGRYGFSIEYDPSDIVAKWQNKNILIDIDALSIGMVRESVSKETVPEYSRILYLDEKGNPDIQYWEQLSEGFNFKAGDKESKEDTISKFYIEYRLPIALKYLQNIPDIPYWDIYHFRSDDYQEILTSATLFRTKIEDKKAYYIVMPLLIKGFDPAIPPEYVKQG